MNRDPRDRQAERVVVAAATRLLARQPLWAETGRLSATGLANEAGRACWKPIHDIVWAAPAAGTRPRE